MLPLVILGSIIMFHVEHKLKLHFLTKMKSQKFLLLGNLKLTLKQCSMLVCLLNLFLVKTCLPHLLMLTGDAKEVAHTVADALGLDEYHAELLPADKVSRVEALLKQETGKLAFVGDGINDAPVLTRADIGIAMGGLGSDAAIEAADVVLMDDQPGKIPVAIRIARKTVRIVHENIIFALTVKAIVLLMGALGKAPMWLAVFADVGVAFIAILNAMRCLSVDAEKK